MISWAPRLGTYRSACQFNSSDSLMSPTTCNVHSTVSSRNFSPSTTVQVLGTSKHRCWCVISQGRIRRNTFSLRNILTFRMYPYLISNARQRSARLEDINYIYVSYIRKIMYKYLLRVFFSNDATLGRIPRNVLLLVRVQEHHLVGGHHPTGVEVCSFDVCVYMFMYLYIDEVMTRATYVSVISHFQNLQSRTKKVSIIAVSITGPER